MIPDSDLSGRAALRAHLNDHRTVASKSFSVLSGGSVRDFRFFVVLSFIRTIRVFRRRRDQCQKYKIRRRVSVCARLRVSAVKYLLLFGVFRPFVFS